MTLKINSLAPDFKANTTIGEISFHEWLGDSWGVLFSHPKDFTPVCTTELGSLAKMKPEFDKRNVKVMGLSVDPVDVHVKWIDDITDVCGMKPEYPIVAQQAGIEGVVVVQTFIDEKGRVKETLILKGVPNTGLDEAAMEAIRKTRFRPAKQRERAVGVWISIPVTFRLK